MRKFPGLMPGWSAAHAAGRGLVALGLAVLFAGCGDDYTVAPPGTPAKTNDVVGDLVGADIPATVDADAAIDAAEVAVCPAGCDDGNPCTYDHCDAASGCKHTPNAFPCNDGNACTEFDACKGGVCAPGPAIVCDDKNVCTTDACDIAAGCTHTAIDGPCDDGDGCTANDACQNGKCGSGAALTCDDGNPCTNDSCDLATGCTNVANESPCTDGNACTQGDACQNLQCISGAAKVCDDNNPCTSNGCESYSGLCMYAANTATCDDGDACTTGDVCSAGGCSGKRTCACATAADCDDKNVCTLDTCDAGKCSYVEAATDVTCSDNNACTTGDACGGGVCLPGAASSCDDGNPCTADACVPELGCVNGPWTAPCDDGNPATLGDTCQGGVCIGLPAACTSDVACSDGNACTDDACVAGACAHKPAGSGKACEDGNGCTHGDACLAGVCLPGAPTGCDDGNACTDDACDPKTGLCQHVANATPCNDGNVCTTQDACAGGVCGGAGKLFCDDGNLCTDDACDPATGCTHSDNTAPCDDGNACTLADACTASACAGGPALACNDGNPCTDDSCDFKSGCQHQNNVLACDDGSACTLVDVCVDGGCVGSTAPECDDNKVCTTDACVAATGCVHKPNQATCSDGDACTTQDTCAAGACVGGAAPDCGDDNACTIDSCDAGTGCTHANVVNDTQCGAATCSGLDHGDAKSCFAGICLPGKQVSCDDGNVCTDDGCDAAAGCTHKTNAAPCDDGSLCTSGDTCVAGTCLGGKAVSCDDQNACSIDSCDPQQGCQHANASNGTACAEASCAGGVFSPDGSCAAGACVASGAPVPCDDKNTCTQDLCSPTTGCTHTDNNAGCSDGDACTSGDACLNGACSPGTPVTCADDGNPCTDNVCDNVAGCVVVNNVLPCNDLSVCTTGDKCTGGACSGTPVQCDDSNVCTNDACELATGCTHTDNALACDDGNPCTTGDVCASGTCKGTGGINCDDGNPCTADLCDPLDNGSCKHTTVGDGATCGTGTCDGAGYQGPPTCLAGSCQASVAPVQSCDDANPCTSDICNAAQGCVHGAVSAACNDGSLCTVNDACAGGVCTGTPLACDDGNVCTDDGCSATLGCTHGLNSAPCSDGNACTVKDQCNGGACVGTAAKCDDGTPCTIDSCNVLLGCVHTPTAGACSDGNACTTNDACAGGVCVGGAAPVCNDGKVCTNDACDPVQGCVATNNTAACDDGKPCTSGDTCAGGVCVGGATTVCDDKNPCTIDSCDAIKGCVSTAGNNGQVCQAASCPSATSFAAAGTCLAGQCAVPAVKSCSDGIDCTADTCDAATGCKNTTKAYGSTCTTAAAGLKSPFCAGTLCTGFEVTTTQTPTATLSGLTGIDRPAGNYGIYATGWNNAVGGFYGIVAAVTENPLGTTLNTWNQNDIYYDVRNRLAVGGATNGQGAIAAVMNNAGTWSSINGPAITLTRPLYAVDRATNSVADRYFVGGASDATQDVWTTFGRVTHANSWGSFRALGVADQPGAACGQIAMEVADIYAAADNAVFLAGPIYAGNTPVKSVVAVYDGNNTDVCGALSDNVNGFAYTSVAGTAGNVVDVSAGVNPMGIFRAIHGTSATHLLVGGSLGTLRSYDNGTWTTQKPVVGGMAIAGNAAFDVRSVFTTGNDGWAAGHYDDPLTKCRTVFALHGSFASATSTWTWDKLWLASDTLMTCSTPGSTNLDATSLYKVWSDPNTGSLYFVGSQGTDSTGKTVFVNATQIRQLLMRVKLQ